MKNNLHKHILLVDDDIFMTRLLALVLKKTEYEIISVNSGKAAMAILLEQSVDMIIVDLIMPEMDGLAFLQWLRQEAKITAPALVLTAMVTANTEKQVMAAGATALLYKPIKASELIIKIQQLL